MARSTSYGRAISPAELDAMRRQSECDNRLYVVAGIRGAVRLIHSDANPAEPDPNVADKAASGPFNWEDDPTLADPAIPLDPRPLDVGRTAVDKNALLYLTAPDSCLKQRN